MPRSDRAFTAAYARAVRRVAAERGVDARDARRAVNRALAHHAPAAILEPDAPPAADARVLAESGLHAFTFTREERAVLPRVGTDALARAHETALAAAARGAAGAYYTDRAVSALVTRLTVYHHLADALAWAPSTARGRALLRLIVDAPPERALASVRRALTPADVRALTARVDALTVSDPACGAGAFLVTALHALTRLHARLHALAGNAPPPVAALHARVVTRNLHGSDVDAGAVELARYRLWTATGGAVVPRNVRVRDALTSPLPERGFHVIVGNPPYFRMEDAAPDGETPRAYHEAVVDAVYAAWPEHAPAPAFRTRAPGALARAWPRVAARASATGTWPLVLDRRSDVSVHFVLRALAMLRPGGTLGFVTTNSWLDTAYGAPLRGHLAGHAIVHALVESATARSFGDAAVNTVILVAGRPDGALTRDALEDRVTRFASYRGGFPDAVDAAAWERVLTTRSPRADARVRVRAVDQRALYAHGTADPGVAGDPRALPHTRGAWGRAFFRTPPALERLLHAGRGVLEPLGNVARVAFGVKTGCNAFFHATGGPPPVNGFGDVVDVEDRFLEPVLRSPKSVPGWRVDPREVDARLVRLPADADALTPAARAFIARGERLRVPVKKGALKGTTVTGVHRLASVRSRDPWWALGNVPRARLAFQQAYGSRLRVLHATAPVAVDARLYACVTDADDALLAAVLNSSLALAQIELAGRVNFGDGALDVKVRDVERLLVPRLDVLAPHRARIVRAFERVAARAPLPFWEEVEREDRRALDHAVLDACGLAGHVDALLADAGAPTWDRVTRAASARARA